MRREASLALEECKAHGCQQQPVLSQLDARCGSAWPCHFRSIQDCLSALGKISPRLLGSEMWGASHDALRSMEFPGGQKRQEDHLFLFGLPEPHFAS